MIRMIQNSSLTWVIQFLTLQNWHLEWINSEATQCSLPASSFKRLCLLLSLKVNYCSRIRRETDRHISRVLWIQKLYCRSHKTSVNTSWDKLYAICFDIKVSKFFIILNSLTFPWHFFFNFPDDIFHAMLRCLRKKMINLRSVIFQYKQLSVPWFT